MADGFTAIDTELASQLDADATLTSLGLNRIFVGVPPEMLLDYMPAIEIMVTNRTEASSQTGTRKHYLYTGYLLVSILVQDTTVSSSRIVRVASYDSLKSYIAAIYDVFITVANVNLGNLTFTNGTVINFDLSREVEAGIAQRDSRDDNITNYAIIPFEVETLETN